MTLLGCNHAEGQTGLTSDGEEKSGTSFPAFFFLIIFFLLQTAGTALPVNTVEGDSALLNSLRVVKRPSS